MELIVADITKSYVSKSKLVLKKITSSFGLCLKMDFLIHAAFKQRRTVKTTGLI